MKHRLFIALDLPETIKTILCDMSLDIAGARWMEEAQLHLTLVFLGNCDHHQAEDVAHSLLDVRAPAFDLRLDGLGLFEKKGRADSLWVGVRPHAPLQHLYQKLMTRLRPLGLDLPARAYLPHITLARLTHLCADTAPFMALHAGLTSPPFHVADFCLFESHLTRDGAHYEIINRYRLSA